MKVQTILSDNVSEYCGRSDKHPYELFLQLEEIEHRTTKVGRPQSNGFIERFHRTLLESHLRIKGRTTWFETARGDAEGAGRLSVRRTTPVRPQGEPRDGGEDALRGLQGPDPTEAAHPETLSHQEGGQDSSVGLTSARPGVR